MGLSALAGLVPQGNNETWLEVQKANAAIDASEANRKAIEAGIPLTQEQTRGAKLKNDLEDQAMRDQAAANQAWISAFANPPTPPTTALPSAAPMVPPTVAPSGVPLPAGQPQPQMPMPAGVSPGVNPGQPDAPLASAPTVAAPVPIAPQAAGLPVPGASLQPTQPAAAQSRPGFPKMQQVMDAYRKAGGSFKGGMALQESLLTLAQKYHEKDTGDLAQEESAHKLLQGPVLALSLAKTAPEQDVAYGVFRDQTIKSEPDMADKLPPRLSQDPNERASQIGMIQAHHNAGTALAEHTKLTSEGSKNQAAAGKDIAETGKAQAETGKLQAETPGEAAKSQISQMEADAAKNITPEEVGKMVTGSIDAKKYPDQHARTLNDAMNALRAGLGRKGVIAAIKDGSDRVSQRENAIAQAQVTSIPFREAALQNQHFQQTQQSYQFHASELDKLAQPVIQTSERIQRLNDTLAQNTPQADALVAPELLSVMSGGSGSGLRMNEAEISRILGGRSKWEDLKASINKWSTDPSKANSITPDQRAQIHSLADVVTGRVNERLQTVMKARSALAGASGAEQHRAIMSDTVNKMGTINTEPSNKPGASTPSVPAGVSSVLSKSAPGIYTLSDKSKWKKSADGTITPQ